MVERAVDRVVDHKPLRQRPVVVGAVCADRVKAIAAPRQDDLVLADATEEDAAFGNLSSRHAFCQVPRWRSVGFFFSHDALSLSPLSARSRASDVVGWNLM
jgi:hypothetical protein